LLTTILKKEAVEKLVAKLTLIKAEAAAGIFSPEPNKK
jgi:hypothetical protein